MDGEPRHASLKSNFEPVENSGFSICDRHFIGAHYPCGGGVQACNRIPRDVWFEAMQFDVTHDPEIGDTVQLTSPL